MKLTPLGCGKDPSKESGLACHLLNINQSCILLECPLDLSALSLFLPTFLSSYAAPQVSVHKTRLSKFSRSDLTARERCRVEIAANLAGRKRVKHFDAHQNELLRSSTSTKKIHLSYEVNGDNGENVQERVRVKDFSSFFRKLNGQVLADGEPWYKVAGLELVDIGLLDAVVISNPSGMLGLPFLTKHPDFCGKVFASKATAEIGRMMMEELVAMHADYIQRHETQRCAQKPPWLDPSILGSLPEDMRGSSLDRCFSNRANWQPLYSADDIRNCFDYVQKMRFGEVVNVNGLFKLSPSSSGMGIGASNWIISGARHRVGYIAASLAIKNHAMPFDNAPLEGCHALIISDVKGLTESDVVEKVISSDDDLDVKVRDTHDCVVSGNEHFRPVRQSSTGSGSSQRPTSRASGSFSSVASRSGLPSGGSAILKSGAVALLPGGGSDKAGKGVNGDGFGTLRNDVAALDLRPELAAACNGAIEAVKRGGSVLFPIGPSGLPLELLEELGIQLGAANLKQTPIHYISPVAEEMLAFCNTVPEWLCSARQEKLYAGESLFGYVELVQEERLRHSKTYPSSELQRVWQEPCVVFATHLFLRMGPAAHLLHRWRQNPLCLLILTEKESDMDLLLAPYMPLAMQVLELPTSSRLSSKEVASVLESVQPKVALVPEFLQKPLEGAGSSNTKVVLGYKIGRSVSVSNFETELEVDMSAELALLVQPKLVKSRNVAAAPFQAGFCSRDGIHSLQIPAPSSNLVMSSLEYHYRWGQVNVGALSRALQERGMSDVSVHGLDESLTGREGPYLPVNHKPLVVEIRSPSRAWIELGPNSSHIKANDPSTRHLIADAVNSALHVM